MSDRRTFLAALLASASGYYLTRSLGVGCTRITFVEAEPFAPVEQLPSTVPSRFESAVETGLREGSVAVQVYGPAPLDDGRYLERDGSFYRIDHRATETESVPAVAAELDWEEGQSAPADASVVSFADLSAADRDALRTAALAGEYWTDSVELPTRSWHREGPVPYEGGVPDAPFASGDVAWLAWRDREIRVRVRGETTAERRTVRYGFERVADSPAAFRTYVADRYAIELTDLSEAERDVLSRAREGGYRECGGRSTGVEYLTDRLPSDEHPPGAGGWYVERDGERFRVDVEGAIA